MLSGSDISHKFLTFHTTGLKLFSPAAGYQSFDHDDHSHAGHDHGDHAPAPDVALHIDRHDSTDHKFVEDEDVNMHAAWLHVMTDLVQSIGVAIGGLIIWIKPNWQIADAICTVRRRNECQIDFGS